ncbi:MAG: polyprenyl synthetase family protein [Nitrospiraceae bacterium]|nr:MAG: polyprenyl synthetase family protein [Nitrospiraceae bacterium]
MGIEPLVMDCKEYIDTKSRIVDSFLRDYFKGQSKPAVLQEAMLYSLFAGGKRLRPILALASYEACGGNAEDIVPYAATLELVHTYSLIHDDLPTMDNDDFRRGQPTNHKVYGEAVAILAGDALLTEAFSILSGMPRPANIKHENIIRIIREISEAAGINGMVAGQVQDLLSENKQPDRQTLEFIHTRKTAALIRASVRLGPILYDSSREVHTALTHYGNSVGLAFQIIDDILDIEGKTEDLGKPVGSDERINKMTYPRVYGIEKSREIAEQLITDGISSISTFSSDADPLRRIARYLLIRKN